MLYPSAPWTLQGHAFQMFQLAEISKVRSTIPSEVEILSILPGKTLGGVYLARYDAGSTLEYSELIVVAAYVKYAGKSKPRISHIYVDNPASVAGGREIWSLPKELADFTWDDDSNQVIVRQKQLLCRLRWNWQLPLWQQGLSASSFCTLHPDFLFFDVKGRFKLRLVGATLDVPRESPFSGLSLGQPWLAIAAQEMNLAIDPPKGLKK